MSYSELSVFRFVYQDHWLRNVGEHHHNIFTVKFYRGKSFSMKRINLHSDNDFRIELNVNILYEQLTFTVNSILVII